MDLNDLLFRHQVSLMREQRAGCSSTRSAHRGLAAGYADTIARLQRSSGARAGVLLRATPAA